MKEFGEYLRNERLARGVTLEEIERRTRIRKQHLTAIEAGEFHRLPEAAYVKAFLRHYAKCVGLDPNTVVEQYEQLHGASAATEVAAASVSGRSERRLRQLKARRRRRIGQWVVLLLIVAGIVGTYFGEDLYEWVQSLPVFSSGEIEEAGTESLFELSNGQAVLPETIAPPEESATSSTVAHAPAVDASAEIPADPVGAETVDSGLGQASSPPPTTRRGLDLERDPVIVPAASDTGFTLGLAASDTSWAELYVDGERVLYRNLAPGEQVSYLVQREASLRLGRAAVVELSVDGQPMGSTGEGVASRRFIIDDSLE